MEYWVTLAIAVALAALCIGWRWKRRKYPHTQIRSAERIYLERLTGLKKEACRSSFADKPIKNMKILMTAYVFEQHGITVKTVVGPRERSRLERDGMPGKDIQQISGIFDELRRARNEGFEQSRLVSLYNAGIAFFMSRNAETQRQ